MNKWLNAYIDAMAALIFAVAVYIVCAVILEAITLKAGVCND